MSIQIIETYLNKASEQEKTEGLTWYQEAHEYCKELSKEFGIELKKVVGILSALSVQKRWDTNKRITRRFLEGDRRVHFKHQVAKAVAIYNGMEPEIALGGLKTVNFYYNILNPKDNNWITIDRWILRMFNETAITPKKYQRLKQPFIDYSSITNMVGCQVQAICWIVCRGGAN